MYMCIILLEIISLYSVDDLSFLVLFNLLDIRYI